MPEFEKVELEEKLRIANVSPAHWELRSRLYIEQRR